jgi:predicted enzyme related to lactoylglutathione lyase
MSTKSIDLIWIVVKDLKKALEFYTEIMGLKLMELNEQYGWAELQGKDGGVRLGIAQMNDYSELSPGQNAVVALTVENIEKAKASLISQGAKCLGEMQEVPGQVKLQMVVDHDGNHLQLAEMLK